MFGIVLVALGLKESLVDLADPLPVIPAAALLGGIAVYLVAHVAFRLRMFGTLSVQRLVVAVVLVALVPVVVHVSALAALGVATSVIVLLVAYEALRFGDDRHQIRYHAEETP